MKQAPQIWNYHPASRRLIPLTEPFYPDADPMNPGSWLFPAGSTTVEPGLDIVGKEQIFDPEIGAWHYEDVPEGREETTPAIGESTPQQLLAYAIQQRDHRLSTAALRIAPLQDAVDLGLSTESEKELLEKWKRYRIALGRVEQQSDFPRAVVWPISPEEAVKNQE